MSAAPRDVVNAAVAKFLKAWKASRAAAPRVGVVLGSGLSALADEVEGRREIDPVRCGFPKPSVPGHAARVVAGKLSGVPVAVFVGRIHAYEGHPLPVVGLTARFLCAAGVRAVVLTNAAGSLREDWRPGDAMLIRDHVNLLGGSPLEGADDADFGSRFVDMGAVWSGRFRIDAIEAAPPGLTVREGVYAACRGPQYETPAEVRMLQALGADAVGMSTVPEAIVAAQMGVPALGISLITNHAAGVGDAPLSHDEVLAVGRAASPKLAGWIERIVPLLDDPRRSPVTQRRPAARGRKGKT